MRLLVTRPEAEAQVLRTRLRTLGYEADCAPMLRIENLPVAALPLDGVTALLFTSANGVRAFCASCARRDFIVHAVGEASAAAATAAGFVRVHAAGGDVDSLAALVRVWQKPQDGALLHAAGATLAGDLQAMLAADGYDIRRVTLYAAHAATALPPETAARFAAGDYAAVLFFSPRTAATFVTLSQAAGIAQAPAGCIAICLSDNVARAVAPLGWQDIRVAATPRETDLLALLELGLETDRA